MKAVLYETLRTFQGRFALFAQHEARFEKGCKSLGILCPSLGELVEREKLEQEALGIKKDLKIVIKVDEMGLVVVQEEVLPWWDHFLYPEIWSFDFVEYERSGPTEKRFDPVKTQLREQSDVDEVLLVDQDGFIREGSLSNVWFVEGNSLVTAPADLVLPGVSRALILQMAKELGIVVEERLVSVEEWQSGKLDALFLSNSVRGMVWTTAKPVPEVLQGVADQCTEFILKKIHERD